MRIVIISDTHGMHDDLDYLSGDLLIHCGDHEDLPATDIWFSTLDFEQIIAIAGNHDYEAEQAYREGRDVFRNAHFLCDETFVYHGLNIFGSPWIYNLEMAFALDNAGLEKKWAAIPDDTDILITHMPPLEILDQGRQGFHYGCPFLRDRVFDLNLRIHCFGHIHASHGQHDAQGITFYNAANTLDHQIHFSPIVLEW